MDYAAHYDRLISRARTRQLDGYFERHHIVPRCMGGGDEIDNLVNLTPEEHYVAHQLLVKIYPTERKLVFAAWMMSNTKAQSNNKTHGWLRRKQAEAMRELWTGRTRGNRSEEHKRKLSEANKGKKFSEEQRAKMSLASRGKKMPPRTAEHSAKLAQALTGKKRGPLTEDHRKKIADAHTGRKCAPFSVEHRNNLSKSKQGVKRGEYKHFECPHCGKLGKGGAMKQWHFDKCKVVNGTTE
jgi:hypothetical protein